MGFPLAIPIVGKLAAKLVGPIILKILAFIGISVLAFQGMELALDGLRDFIEAEISSLPVEIVDVFGAIGLDVYVSMVFSAILLKWTVKGLSGGVFKALRW
jgi:hypothetical protein